MRLSRERESIGRDDRDVLEIESGTGSLLANWVKETESAPWAVASWGPENHDVFVQQCNFAAIPHVRGRFELAARVWRAFGGPGARTML